MVSRRGFIGAGASAAGLSAAALAAGCGEGDELPLSVDTPPAQQIDRLNAARRAQLEAIAVYEQGAERLDGGDLEMAELFAEQDAEHADALAAAIEELGGAPVDPLADEQYERRLDLADLGGAEDVLRLAAELEDAAVGALNEAVGLLTDAAQRRTLYEIVAADAAHLTVILGALGELQVPSAFVAGAR